MQFLRVTVHERGLRNLVADGKRYIDAGIFCCARCELEEGRFGRHDVKRIRRIFRWFNDHITCPPFSEKRWSPYAISWWKEPIGGFSRQLFSLCQILARYKLRSRFLLGQRIGKIVYEDQLQVVAEPPTRGLRPRLVYRRAHYEVYRT